jgi:hypothetical protein
VKTARSLLHNHFDQGSVSERFMTADLYTTFLVPASNTPESLSKLNRILASSPIMQKNKPTEEMKK